MENRTLYALIAVAALLVTGVAAAETNSTDNTAETPARAPCGASSSPCSASTHTWSMELQPKEAWVKAGESATYSLLLKSRVDTEVKLTIRKATEGAVATLSSETIDITPGGSSRVALTITGSPDAKRSPYIVLVDGVSADGEHHDARAALYVRTASDRPTSVTKPLDVCAHATAPRCGAAEARPVATEDKLSGIETRLLAMRHELDSYLKLIHEMRGDTDPIEKPAPGPKHDAIRVALANEVSYFGPDGGRIAVLVHNDGDAGILHLKLRYNESAPWRAALVDTDLKVPHGDTWTFVKVQPAGARNAGAVTPFAFALVSDATETALDGRVIFVGPAATGEA